MVVCVCYINYSTLLLLESPYNPVEHIMLSIEGGKCLKPIELTCYTNLWRNCINIDYHMWCMVCGI